MALFQPRAELTDGDRQRALSSMRWQAITSSGADGLASGGLLAAFALLLGAGNVHIGEGPGGGPGRRARRVAARW